MSGFMGERLNYVQSTFQSFPSLASATVRMTKDTDYFPKTVSKYPNVGCVQIMAGQPGLFVCLQTLGLVFLAAAKIDDSVVAGNIDLGGK